MALNRAAFEQRMEKLNASQQSIEGTSSWCTMWRSDAETLVGWWETYFHQADEKKKLSLVYLANDILQTRYVALYFWKWFCLDVVCQMDIFIYPIGASMYQIRNLI